MNDGLSVIVPVHNEESSISRVIKDIRSVLGRMNMDAEIIVVDDGSTDKSVDIIREEAVVCIRHSSNKGYGAALKTGVRRSKYGLIAIIDADLSYPADALLGLVKKMDEYDMVVGSRDPNNANISFMRKFAKCFLNLLANYLVGFKVPDLNSGFRVIKKSILEEYLHIMPNGFSFTTTITLAAITGGYSVYYMPVNYKKRSGNSKIKPIPDTFRFINLILTTIIYFRPLRVFMPLSIVILIADITVALYTKIILGRIWDITVILLFVLSVQVWMLGMVADLIVRRSSK